MEIDFLFKEELERQKGKTFIYEDDLKDVKGLSLGPSNKIFINLNAEQWKEETEEELLKEMFKTITHEICHLEIFKRGARCTSDGEETVCQMFAEQHLSF